MKRSNFTLVEVLVAIAILGLGLGAAFSIASQAHTDLIRAQERWEDAHALEQAVEHYLLQDPRAMQGPDDLLGSYGSSCTLERAPDAPYEYANEPYQGWLLGLYTIRVTNREGELAGEQQIYKWIPEEDL